MIADMKRFITRPFFCYFGGKWRIAKRYPRPVGTVIEPFAGAAGYSTWWGCPRVKLFDVNEKVVGTWDWLIKARPADVLRLPIYVEHVDDVKGPQEVKWLIGWWFNAGVTSPCTKRTAWRSVKGPRPDSCWGSVTRSTIAKNVEKIKGWTVERRSWEDVPDEEVTWFVDPPYHSSGRFYVYSDVDYLALAEWCRDRTGRVIACEQAGAEWLPFRHLHHAQGLVVKGGVSKVSREVVWTKGC